MRRVRGIGAGMMLIAAVLTMVVPATAWSQDATPGGAGSGTFGPRDAVAVLGAVAGSLVYFPFKVLLMCPGMGVASVATYMATNGNPQPAEHLARVGCTGSYWVTPGMIQGREEFLASGKETAVRGR